MVIKLEFPAGDDIDADRIQLRGSVGRSINFLHSTRVGLARKPLEKMGGIDIIYEAVREDNPRGFNRKIMKACGGNFGSCGKLNNVCASCTSASRENDMFRLLFDRDYRKGWMKFKFLPFWHGILGMP